MAGKAESRLIYNSISTSDRVASLGVKGALLFTWLITHCDSQGRMPAKPLVLKHQVVPLLEEMLFRGLFQTTIRSYIESFRSLMVRESKPEKEQAKYINGAWLAIVISSLLFTINHANAGHFPALFVLGVCLGYSYEKSGSLFRPVFIHAIFNAISVIATLYK